MPASPYTFGPGAPFPFTVPHVAHDAVEDLAAACDIICLCVDTDDDVAQLAERLLDGLRAGSVVAVETDLVSYCRNQYRARRDADGVWRFVRLTSIYVRDTLIRAIPGARLDLDPDEFTPFRPSYRCLAWYQHGLGLTVREDLLGNDWPEPVAAQYRSEHAWLHHTTPIPAT